MTASAALGTARTPRDSEVTSHSPQPSPTHRCPETSMMIRGIISLLVTALCLLYTVCISTPNIICRDAIITS
jgi:hypothetical protein